MGTDTKPPRITPYSVQWERKADALARSQIGTIYPCAKCSHPVITGYVCGTCGTSKPRER